MHRGPVLRDKTASSETAAAHEMITVSGVSRTLAPTPGAPPVPATIAASATVRGAVRRTSWMKLSFLLVVVLPSIVAGLYSLLLATPRFTSEFRAAIRSAEPMKSGGIAEIFGIGGVSQSGNDASAVVQYLHSRDSVEALERRIPLRSKFTDDSIDFISRYHGPSEIEPLTRYWNSMIEAYYETSTGTVVVKVTAFSPADALNLARLMLSDSEELINKLSRRVREDSVAFAEGELAKAEARLADARKQLQALQDKEAILDPMKSAEVNTGLATKLKEQIAQRNAELATMRSRLARDAPSVRTAEETIAGLKRELAHIEGQATVTAGTESGRPLSTVFGAFQQVADQKSFAEKAYLSALSSLESARVEANRQQVYLSVIVAPGLPQEASFPRPLRQIGLTLMISLAVWLVGLLSVYSVREHM